MQASWATSLLGLRVVKATGQTAGGEKREEQPMQHGDRG